MRRWTATASSSSTATASVSTRVPGQFEFDKDGFLTDRISGARVMVSSESSALGSLQIDPFRVFQPRATTEVKLAGNLARSGTSTFDLTNVTVLDSSGAKQTLKVRFVRADDPSNSDTEDDTETGDDTETTPPALTWKVEVLDSDNKVLGSGTLVFNSDGTPASDQHRHLRHRRRPRICRNSRSP